MFDFVRRIPLFAIIALSLGGCLDVLVPYQPGPATDGGASDAAHAPTPDLTPTPSGGNDLATAPSTLTYAAVQTGVDSKGCSGSACHGGLQTPVLKAMPAAGADMMANYTSFKSGCVQGKCVDTVTPEASLMLKKPLNGSGLTHAGGKLFTDTNDPVYVEWLAWIKAGTPY